METLPEFEKKLAMLLLFLQRSRSRVALGCTWFTTKGTMFVRVYRADNRQVWYFIRVHDGQMFGVKGWDEPNFDINFWTLDTFLRDMMQKEI